MAAQERRVELKITPGVTKFLPKNLTKKGIIMLWWDLTKLFVKEFFRK